MEEEEAKVVHHVTHWSVLEVLFIKKWALGLRCGGNFGHGINVRMRKFFSIAISAETKVQLPSKKKNK